MPTRIEWLGEGGLEGEEYWKGKRGEDRWGEGTEEEGTGKERKIDQKRRRV